MSFYFDCLHLIRLHRKFMILIGLIPVKISLRALQISIVFLIVASVPFMRLLNSEQSVFLGDNELTRIVNISNLLVLWIVHIVILLETSYKADEFDKIILQFEKIQTNALFESYCKVSSYKKINWESQSFRVYMFMFLEFVELLILSWTLHFDGLTWIRWCFNVYSDITLKTKLFEFIIFVALTNAMQHDLCSATTKVITNIQSTQHNEWRCRRNALQSLSTIGHLRNEIWMAVKMIEDFCAYSLVGVLLKMYCDILLTAYWAYRSFDFESAASYKTVYLLFLLVRVLILLVCCWLCTSCEILERIFITKLPLGAKKGTDAHLYSIIKDLSLDLLHKRIQFSAADIITINFQCLGEMIFSAVTFVVILIQFHMEGVST